MLKKPEALTPNSKIAIVSLSSGILGESFADHQLQLGIRRLQEMKLVPVLMPNALKGLTYLAHHPQARADDLKTAFADPEIKGIVCAIGGDDTYRLLPYLLEDETFIHNVQASPKLFTGFSDTTINHLMFYQLGMQSFYGPNFLNDLAELDQEMLPYTKHTFMNYFRNEATASIKSSPIWYEEREDFSPAVVGTKRIQHVEQKRYEVLEDLDKLPVDYWVVVWIVCMTFCQARGTQMKKALQKSIIYFLVWMSGKIKFCLLKQVRRSPRQSFIKKCYLR